MINLPMLFKLWLVFFSSLLKNFLVIKNLAFKRIKTLLERMFSDLWSQLFYIKLEKKEDEKNIFFLYFWGKPCFSESALFHREMVGLTNLRPDIGRCLNYQCGDFHQNYLSTNFRISFDELLKVTTVSNQFI